MDSSRTILPLALEGVSFAAGGQTLVHDLSLEIAGGSRTIMLGPNGAGKSLILRLCHGLLRPSAGCVVWRGPDAAQGAPPRPSATRPWCSSVPSCCAARSPPT